MVEVFETFFFSVRYFFPWHKAAREGCREQHYGSQGAHFGLRISRGPWDGASLACDTSCHLGLASSFALHGGMEVRDIA